MDYLWLWTLLLILLISFIILVICIRFIQKYRTSPYSQELEQAEYLVTYGFIRGVKKSIRNGSIELNIEYINLAQELVSKTFIIRPIQLLLYTNEAKVLLSNPIYFPKSHRPELLVEQQVELCLLPTSHFMLQIRLIDHVAHFTEIWQHKLHKRAVFWHLHSSGIPHHCSPYALANVQSIQVTKTATAFELLFQCVEQDDFSIPSDLVNFKDIELQIETFFKGFDQSAYERFKQHSELNSIELWQTSKPISSTLQKQQQNLQVQLSTSLLFAVLMIIFVIICQYSIGWGILYLIFSLTLLFKWFFVQRQIIGFYDGEYFILNQTTKTNT